MRTLVIGLGNPILTDDGVGPRVAEAVRVALPAGTSADVREASVGGLTLMEDMLGYDRVILIDAFQQSGGEPGTVLRLTLEDLRSMEPSEHTNSPHDLSLARALELGSELGLPLPREIVVYAVQTTNVTDFGEEPTPAVAAAVHAVAAAVLAELAQEADVEHH